MDAILRRAVRRVFLWLPWNEVLARVYRNLYRFLLGNDIFVSYGRRDGTRYPEALVRRLVREGLVCYYDRLGAPPGTTVAPRVLAQARNSSMLVVVAGPAAAASENVREEIAAFGPQDRSAIPIDFGGSLQHACWLDLVPGITPEQEPLSSLDQGEVSEAVVQRIAGAEDFVSRDRRLRQVFQWVAGGVVAVVCAAALYSALRIRVAEDRRQAAEVEQTWAQMGTALERLKAGVEPGRRAAQGRKPARSDSEVLPCHGLPPGAPRPGRERRLPLDLRRLGEAGPSLPQARRLQRPCGCLLGGTVQPARRNGRRSAE